MKQLKLTATVTGGKFPPMQRLQEAIRAHEGKLIDITIKRSRKRRSNPQNAFYWGVVLPLIREAIQDAYGEAIQTEQVHDYLKNAFNVQELINEGTGEVIQIPRSTTALSTIEFEDYILACKGWAKDVFELHIPEPNEQLEIG